VSTKTTADQLYERLQANIHAVISELHGCEPPNGQATWPSEDALMVTAQAYAEALAQERELAVLEEAHRLVCHSPCLTPGNCRLDGLRARLGEKP